MKLIVAIVCSLFSITLAQQCQIETCEDLENALVEAEKQVEVLVEENQRATQKQKRLQDKLRQLNFKVFPAGKLFASCQELHDQRERQAGPYQIQPSMDYSPFWVICEFDDDFGYTYLYPNMTNEFGLTAPPLADGGCDPRGCYKDQVHYNSTTIDQIEALMEVSSHCQQKIAHNCSVNAISRYAYWTDRRGLYELEYWDGSHDDTTKGCQCSLNEGQECSNLHNAFNLCNCDDLNTDAYDEGIITNMEHLPVMRLNYGDSGKRYAWIEYNLGPFVCSGKDYLYPSDVLYSDFHFKAAFNESSPYIVDPSYGLLPLKFSNIIYDQTYGSINANLSKDYFTFTAPTDGIYKIELNLALQGDSGIQYQFTFRINNEPVKYISRDLISQANPSYPSISRDTYEATLYRGDELTIMTEVASYGLRDASSYGILEECSTSDVKHSCSFITGQILERIDPKV